MFPLYSIPIYIFSPERLGCTEPVFSRTGRGMCSISHSWEGARGKRGGKALPAFLLCPGVAPNEDCSNERQGLNQLSSRAHPLTEACRTFIFSPQRCAATSAVLSTAFHYTADVPLSLCSRPSDLINSYCKQKISSMFIKVEWYQAYFHFCYSKNMHYAYILHLCQLDSILHLPVSWNDYLCFWQGHDDAVFTWTGF